MFPWHLADCGFHQTACSPTYWYQMTIQKSHVIVWSMGSIQLKYNDNVKGFYIFFFWMIIATTFTELLLEFLEYLVWNMCHVL